MKGVLALAAVVLLAAPPPAAATQRGPVQGGGSFTEAPLVDEGNYSDTIRLTEELFYAVELERGQGLRVTAQLLGQNRGPSDPAVLGQLQIYNPSDALFFSAPGTYYFSLRFYRNVGPDRGSPIRRREYKTRYKVNLTGVALEPSPSASPTEEPSATEEPSPDPAETEDPGGAAGGPSEPASDDTPYVRVYLMTFLIGLILGFGVVVARGFAARSAPTRRA